MILRTLLKVLTGLALMLADWPAMAQDLVVERAIFSDPSGMMTPAEVRRASFVPSGAIINQGYTKATLWVRLTVDAPKDTRRLKLRVTPAHPDAMHFFTPQAPDQAIALKGGAAWVAAQPGRAVYYLRLQSTGITLLQPRILSEEQALDDESQRGVLLGGTALYYCVLLAGLLYLIVTRRQLLHVAFLLNITIVAANFFGWMGYWAELLGPHHWLSQPATAFALGFANVFSGFWCIYVVLDSFGLQRSGRRLFAALGVVYLGLFALALVLDWQLILMSAMLLSLAGGAMVLVLTVNLFRQLRPNTWPIGLLLVVAMVLAMRWFLIALDLVPIADSMASMFIFRLLFSIVLLVATVWLLDREKAHALQELARAREQAEAEAQRRHIQERFTAMLMQEMKNPLAIIQLAANALARQMAGNGAAAQGVSKINRSLDDMQVLVERYSVSDQVDAGAMQMHKQELALAPVLDGVLQQLGSERISVLGKVDQQVISDPQFLRLVVQNLLDNALKYSPADSAVTLQVEQASDGLKPMLSLTVANAAGNAGVPDASQVFQRFYRAEGARSRPGAGLGLWLAQSLVRQLGSDIVFHADHGQVRFGFMMELK